jgi:hypothetical protein
MVITEAKGTIVVGAMPAYESRKNYLGRYRGGENQAIKKRACVIFVVSKAGSQHRSWCIMSMAT